MMENMGRVNFGPALEQQRKGIDRSVQINGHQHYHWTEYCLPMEDLSGLDFQVPVREGEPGFYKFTFEADETGDTFLDFFPDGERAVFWSMDLISDVFGRSVSRSGYIYRHRS